MSGTKTFERASMKTIVNMILPAVFVVSICFAANAFGQSQAQKVDAFVRDKMAANQNGRAWFRIRSDTV